MTDRSTQRLLLVCAVVAMVAAAGCLGSAEDPTGLGDGTDDGPTGDEDGPANGSGTNGSDGAGTNDTGGTADGSTGTADGDTDDDAGREEGENETRPAGAPPSIDEPDTERAVFAEIDTYRAQTGFVELRRTRGLAVGSANTTNRDLVVRGVEPPYDGTGATLNLSTRELLERFRAEGGDVCTGRTSGVAGLMSSVRDVTAIEGVTAAGAGTSYADAIADDVVTSWTRGEATREVIRGGYRFVGVDARYDASRGAVYVTAAVC